MDVTDRGVGGGGAEVGEVDTREMYGSEVHWALPPSPHGVILSTNPPCYSTQSDMARTQCRPIVVAEIGAMLSAS